MPTLRRRDPRIVKCKIRIEGLDQDLGEHEASNGGNKVASHARARVDGNWCGTAGKIGDCGRARSRGSIGARVGTGAGSRARSRTLSSRSSSFGLCASSSGREGSSSLGGLSLLDRLSLGLLSRLGLGLLLGRLGLCLSGTGGLLSLGGSSSLVSLGLGGLGSLGSLGNHGDGAACGCLFLVIVSGKGVLDLDTGKATRLIAPDVLLGTLGLSRGVLSGVVNDGDAPIVGIEGRLLEIRV
jgi:hypothetical protein